MAAVAAVVPLAVMVSALPAPPALTATTLPPPGVRFFSCMGLAFAGKQVGLFVSGVAFSLVALVLWRTIIDNGREGPERKGRESESSQSLRARHWWP